MSNWCDVIDKLTGCDPTQIPSKDPKARYSRIHISLETSYTDKELYLAGSFIGVAYISGGGSCEIKLDYIASQKINLREIEGIRANFNKIYVTSNGRGGECYLYICQSMETLITTKKTSTFTHTVHSISKWSTNTVKRVTGTGMHLYANRIKIRNTHATYGVEFGYIPFDSIPDTATFRLNSYRLVAQDDIEFTEIDLLGMGFVSTVDDAYVELKMIATML